MLQRPSQDEGAKCLDHPSQCKMGDQAGEGRQSSPDRHGQCKTQIWANVRLTGTASSCRLGLPKRDHKAGAFMKLPSTSALVVASLAFASTALAEELNVVSGVGGSSCGKFTNSYKENPAKTEICLFLVGTRIHEFHQSQSKNAEWHPNRFRRHAIRHPNYLDPRLLPEKPNADLPACCHRAFPGSGTGSSNEIQLASRHKTNRHQLSRALTLRNARSDLESQLAAFGVHDVTERP